MPNSPLTAKRPSRCKLACWILAVRTRPGEVGGRADARIPGVHSDGRQGAGGCVSEMSDPPCE